MKLQNNFTTPEQSKQLLELGVPVDSADCYYMAIGLDAKKYGYSDFPYFMTTNYVDREHVIAGVNIPCWSVGRLIEILSICCKLKPAANIFMLAFWGETIEGLIEEITDYTIYYDFSKLEE